MTQENIDIMYMRRCLRLAANGLGRVRPNPMVGCVVVATADGESMIISEGYHQEYGHNHAERNALLRCDDAAGATLYVNLEPCSHHGHTPPCADLIIEKGIRRVVCCNDDPNPLVAGNGFRKLEAAGIEVVRHVLEDEGRHLNRRFFTFMEKQRPYIILKWAESEDGFIAPDISSQRVKESESQRVKESESQRVKESKSQRVKESESQRVKESESQRVKESKSQRVKESESQRDKESESQRVRESKSQRVKESKSQKVKESKSQRDFETFRLQDDEQQHDGSNSQNLQATKSYWLSTQPQNRLNHRWRTEEAAILVGSETYLKDRPGLTPRHYRGPAPLPVVLDRRGRLGTQAESPAAILPAHWLHLSSPTVEEAVQELYRQKIQSVIVEGGRHILDAFIAAGLYDEVRILRSPQHLGDGLPAPTLPKNDPSLAMASVGRHIIVSPDGQIM